MRAKGVDPTGAPMVVPPAPAGPVDIVPALGGADARLLEASRKPR